MSSLIEVVLQNHTQICDEVYQFLLEENSFVKKTNQPPNEAFAQLREELLTRLESSLTEVKKRNIDPRLDDPVNQERIKIAQHKMAKIFYLSRENEQLLARMKIGNPSFFSIHV